MNHPCFQALFAWREGLVIGQGFEERRTTFVTWKQERSKGTGSDTLRVKILGHVYRVNFLRTEILYGLSYFGVAEEEYERILLLPYSLL